MALEMRKSGSWVVLKSSALQKTPLMAKLLADRFPHLNFRFVPFHIESLFQAHRIHGFEGAIAELKILDEKHLALFDRLLKITHQRHLILILSPESFQLLNRQRPHCLESLCVVLSEIASLDYLAQIPRAIDSLLHKKRLREENEELKRQLAEHDTFSSRRFIDLYAPSELQKSAETVSDLLEQRLSVQGCLKVSMKKWHAFAPRVSASAKAELSALITRLIGSTVRGNDRILRKKENEFFIYLENADESQLESCLRRLSDQLRQFEFRIDDEVINLDFGLEPVPPVA